ncbi:MAG: hypothetical protein K2X82_31720 [Gemmataceae bacterium]|nr:hypothetical protein [Gemmataceae bacterium]
MTITLPDSLKADLERRARRSGFGTADEYVAWLVEEDAEPAEYTAEDLGFANEQELEAKLLASLASPPITVDETFWADLRREVAERVVRGKAP